MSTTKAFPALSLAMLVDERKVAWNDPVAKWLPELVFPGALETRELTVKDLLTHNTGLGNADLLWTRNDLSREDILRRVRFTHAGLLSRDGFVCLPERDVRLSRRVGRARVVYVVVRHLQHEDLPAARHDALVSNARHHARHA